MTGRNWKLLAEVSVAVLGVVGAAFGLYTKSQTPQQASQRTYLSVFPVEGSWPHLDHNYCLAKAKSLAGARAGRVTIDGDQVLEFTVGTKTVMIVCSETQLSVVSGTGDDNEVEDFGMAIANQMFYNVPQQFLENPLNKYRPPSR